MVLLRSGLVFVAEMVAVVAGLAAAGMGWAAVAQEVPALTERQLPGLVTMYEGLHEHPELSQQEAKTSALLAEELRKAGYTVTERVGRYADGMQAYGVVGILKNGAGPTLLVRTDMDALPVEEKTGLPYASKVRTKNPAGQEVPVMHACGHDVHVTTMVGVARNLVALKDRWHGTVMLVGQPAEETISGAEAMMRDRLFERFGRPDMEIALHDWQFAAGTVAVTPGYALASSTGVDVTMRGIGSHASAPNAGKDPVVMSAEFIVALQTVVSRSTPPQSPAVLTVGDIQGGTKRNIIPDEVKMELNFRAFDDEVRKTLMEGIERTAKGVAIAAGVPESRMPMVKQVEYAPAMYNNPELSERLLTLFEAKLGKDKVSVGKPAMASEDFGFFSEEKKIPAVMFFVGALDPMMVEESRKTGTALPTPHSPLFAPVPEPTLRTSVTAMTDAVMMLLP